MAIKHLSTKPIKVAFAHRLALGNRPEKNREVLLVVEGNFLAGLVHERIPSFCIREKSAAPQGVLKVSDNQPRPRLQTDKVQPGTSKSISSRINKFAAIPRPIELQDGVNWDVIGDANYSPSRSQLRNVSNFDFAHAFDCPNCGHGRQQWR